ncbi:hypothetical protein [Desertibacillus haloalkaliphilus]|uniref:hypothetical protein n=1 Tax=Desertibacillus haloalkaliphilus TaxID=1328930 RepID=UPI001C27B3DA|nr:hypothetical protein [Desertibacillus haloalkaliphilus]MBU8907645.1 hypothetical protein [Desertibacillus haloalkaliphilus]
MKDYEIKRMVVDDEYYTEEFVTTDFTYNNQDYSISFSKEDLETVNAWMFEDDKSVPANLSERMIDSIREDVKKRI